MASGTFRAPRRAGAAQGIAITICCALPLMGTVALVPVLPKLLQHFSDVPNYRYWVPIILTVPPLCVGILSAPVGILADLFGRRALLIPALVIYAVFGVAPVFLDNLFAILATRLGVGVGEAVVMTVCTTLIGDYFKGEERAKWFSYWTAGASISVLGCIVVGGYFGNFGWRAPFLIYLSSFICLAGILLYTWEPEPDAEERSQKASWAGFPWLLIVGIAALTGIYAILTSIVSMAGSISFTELGVTEPGTIGIMTAIVTLGGIVGALLFRTMSGFAIALLLLLEFGLMTAGFVAMSHAPNYQAFIAAAEVNRLGGGMVLPTLLIWAMRHLPYHHRSRGTGIFHSGFNIGQFFTPIIMTFLQMQLGGRMLSVFQVMGVVSVIIALTALVSYVANTRQKAAELRAGVGVPGE